MGFITTASLEQKQCLLELLAKEMDVKTPEPFKSPEALSHVDVPHLSEPISVVGEASNFSKFVKHIDDIGINKELSDGLNNELSGLKLSSQGQNGKSTKVKSQWLSPSDEPYTYGKSINMPKPIDAFPFIKNLMDKVNNHPDTSGDMNSCLVTCLSSVKGGLTYHADDQDLISQDSDICTVSVGPARSLDFIWRGKNGRGRKGPPPPPDHSVPATNHSLNIMKAGCQQKLLHRVPPGKFGGVRYSLSFRKIAIPDLPAQKTSNNLPPTANKNNTSLPQNQKKKITLLAGDSYFERLDERKLGKGKKEVFKVAKGGRKIVDVQQAVVSFIKDHPDMEIETLFVCAGTNDIRNCHRGITHLKPALSNFMKTMKQLIPNARIFMQSLLPIPSNGNLKTEVNVLAMNKLIFDLCSRFKIFYLDVFTSFLNKFENRNLNLFPVFDSIKKLWDIHPNSKGMGVLASHYIFILHSKWFNPMGF